MLAVGIAEAPPPGLDPSEALARLKEVTARIHMPGARGEVLPEVLRFGQQVFSRVALFMVRDGQAIGIAQAGLAKAGGPDDAGLRAIQFDGQEPGWFRRVLGEGRPIAAAPADAGDERLGVLLGNELPQEAYVAPILAGGQIVALLYGDQLPAQCPIGDTEALEVVLHAAGAALDRAALQRTLEESDAGTEGPSGA